MPQCLKLGLVSKFDSKGRFVTMSETINTRPATADDVDRIWEVIEPVVVAGDTFALPRDWSRDAALGFWLGVEKRTYVAEIDGQIVGTYFLRTNQLGPGSHVCNCAFVTSSEARGRGVASTMCRHAIEQARTHGFDAMQFNCVVSTNEVALKLWEKLGFEVVGRLPAAFNHPIEGKVDALVMFQTL